jgi:hypothetical protein
MSQDFLRLEIIRLTPAHDPVLHISETARPEVLKGRPGVTGQLLAWFPREAQPRRIDVIDGVVKASLEELLNAVMFRAVPPKWSGSVVSLAEHGDALYELVGTLTLNAMHVADAPEGPLH